MTKLVLVIIAIGLASVLTSACEGHEPVVIASGHGALSPKQPQVAIGANNRVHIAFGIGDTVQYVGSSDGKTFDKPSQAFQVPNMSLGMRRGPRIAATEKSIVITAIGGKIGKGRDGDVISWHSTDNGVSWHGPVRVNDAADSAREGLHAMAAGEDGSIWCVWLDLRDKKTEIYAARSRDNGATWEPNIRVYQSPDGSVCECCHPSVIVTKNGLHVMFRNSLAGNRDMYVTSSKDNGKTFTSALKLGHGTWHLDACPMDGGMLAATGMSTIESVWRREGNIYTATNDGSPEILIGRGQQPWISATKKGSVVVWTTGRDGDLMLRESGSKEARKLALGVRDPIVVMSKDEKGPAICCWEGKKGDDARIVVQRLDFAD